VASAQSGDKLVRYHGYKLVVPAQWPIYNLASDPGVCVRFNRHAVYLGDPSPNQRCRAHAVGRTEAILVEPLAAHAAGSGIHSGPALPPVTSPGAQPRQGSAAQLAVRSQRIMVTATWSRNPGIVTRALGVRSLAAASAAAVSKRQPPIRARSAAAAATYTGLGFDPCSAPSTAAMSAWGSSPYRAAGIYIGGTNMGCSQPNLTSGWVNQESAAGWHLIPTYVGLQAPSNSCRCSGINPGKASSEGSAAARDAIVQAQALSIGAGNPIYFDIEAYPRGGSNTSAVLTFLSAWTKQLHAGGYKSGVYSSASSGIEDLVAQFGTGFVEPDDIWIADWNGARSTSDSYVPSAEWSAHQRLHQYSGGHNETYGGVTINIDGDYLDGATVGAASVTSTSPLRLH
jgi:Rv2525c-like, glycoside hydrolase-like domain